MNDQSSTQHFCAPNCTSLRSTNYHRFFDWSWHGLRHSELYRRDQPSDWKQHPHRCRDWRQHALKHVTDVITAGLLSFTTGNFVSYNSLTQTYTFDSGGSMTITGAGPGCLTIGGCSGNAPNTTSGPTLISGVTVSAQYIAGLVNLHDWERHDGSEPGSILWPEPGRHPILEFQRKHSCNHR